MKKESFYDMANAMMAEVFEKTDRNTNEIFGNNETLPDDELELIFSKPFGELSQPAKLQALAQFRAKKGLLSN